ncbi:MAG: gliding motility-associated C-terminal domain-containing protein [Flavobacteriales bacterium]
MKLAVVTFIAFVPLAMSAQLRNGSFETISSMPNGLGQWQRAQGWSNAGSATASPDLLHYDAINSCDLPETSMGIVQSYDGDAVMGLAVCGRYSTNQREYITNQFTKPMQVGKPYAVGFRITNGDFTPTSLSGLAVDNLGLFFSLTPPHQNGNDPIPASPQLKIESVVYSEDWETYIFTFYPEQPFKYLTFGLFGNDDDKNIQIRNGLDPSFAYYFVDYFTIEPLFSEYALVDGDKIPPVAVEPKPVEGEREFFVPNTFTPNGDGNNDKFLPVAASSEDWTVEIFSSWGDRVFTGNQHTSGWDGVYQGIPCNPGSYVWQITYWEERPNGKPRRHDVRGMFHLVR